MANKDQKRGNRETRKPKQEKPKAAAAISPFIITQAKPGGTAGLGAKKK
jgi:hypothetical protein